MTSTGIPEDAPPCLSRSSQSRVRRLQFAPPSLPWGLGQQQLQLLLNQGMNVTTRYWASESDSYLNQQKHILFPDISSETADGAMRLREIQAKGLMGPFRTSVDQYWSELSKQHRAQSKHH
ncbi:uncharacterized protein AAES06_001649 isoform 1-T1 [Glossophaga mutica]